jgi:hypothetical protein
MVDVRLHHIWCLGSIHKNVCYDCSCAIKKTMEAEHLLQKSESFYQVEAYDLAKFMQLGL